MSDLTRNDVLKIAKERNVKLVRLWFTDILGFLKSFSMPVSELEAGLDEGKWFDGSSVEGFARLEESDLIAMPDPSTFAIMPWPDDKDGKVARMFCEILQPDGTPYPGDPRGALKRIVEKASSKGYKLNVGPELEYFYFRSDRGKPEGLDEGGYFDLTARDVASDLRRETIILLEKLDIPVEGAHHEVAHSQHEIDLRYDDAMTIADRIMTMRLVIKEVALKNGAYATFMPKPFAGQNGSGMHAHFSISDGRSNLFYDDNDPFHMSDIAKQFTAGMLRYVAEFTSITNQWANSYKRLVPGYEAPVYISWGRRNRSELVRVPAYRPEKKQAARVELRSPDPACNPYLAFAVILAAGLKGIEDKNCSLPPVVEDNIYELHKEAQIERGIECLPDNLYAALQLTEKSAFVRETLGDHLFEKFIANKIIEWDNYRTHVTAYEIENYMPIL